MIITLTQDEIQNVVVALQKSDPMGIYATVLIEKIMKEATEQIAHPRGEVKEEKK